MYVNDNLQGVNSRKAGGKKSEGHKPCQEILFTGTAHAD